jgi:hypothetical protein
MLSVVVLAVLSVGLLAGRAALAAHDRSQVRVVTDEDVLACEGTTVENRPVAQADGTELSTPVAAIDDGMRCTYTFFVSNRGGEPMRIERVVFPVLGPDGGAAVEAIALDGEEPQPTETIDGVAGTPVDAIFDLDRSLPAHEAVQLQMTIVYRADGCTSGGATISFPDSPTLTLRSRGVSGKRSAEGPGLAFFGHPVLNCDEP